MRRGKAMDVRIKWVDNAMFMAESGSGHTVVMDGAPENGGKNLGLRPMETLLAGMGGCTAFDVKMILDKARQNVTGCVAEIHADRADAVPAIFTKIHVHFIITGKGLSDKAVARAVNLSAEKYCSASIMLSKAVDITHDYEIINIDE